MKSYIFLIAVLVVLSFPALSQNDSLMVYLKNGQSDIIPLSQLVKIQFENITSVETENISSESISFKGNFPNPFENFTDIVFELRSPADVEINIYDNLGKLVFTYPISAASAGSIRFRWDGKDMTGQALQSGIYFIELCSGLEIKLEKTIILR